MTVDQPAAIALFEGLGFKAEALLRDHVRDVDGKTHDIVVLGHNIAQVQAQLEAYGCRGRCSTRAAGIVACGREGQIARMLSFHEIESRSQHEYCVASLTMT